MSLLLEWGCGCSLIVMAIGAILTLGFLAATQSRGDAGNND